MPHLRLMPAQTGQSAADLQLSLLVTPEVIIRRSAQVGGKVTSVEEKTW